MNIPSVNAFCQRLLALDPSGNIYVTDVGNNNVTELIYSGNAINLGQVAVGSTGPAVAVNYELNEWTDASTEWTDAST